MTKLVANSPKTGILVSDQGDASIPGSGKVLLLRDLDGDGKAASAGEITTFFNAANASGLAAPTENVFSVFQARDRSVFISDGQTDSVYRLVDRNNDGDANDAGEAKVWFSAANAGGFSTVTPNGVAQGRDGAIYITNAGTSSAPPDMIYRTVDRNHDGDANDAGEATVWADLQQVIATSVPFDITFVGDVAYVSDLTGAAEDMIHRLEDKNRNGVVEASEITTYALEPQAYGAPIDIAIDSQDGSILALTWTAGGGALHKLYRLTDVNGDGRIDSPAESVEVWNSSYLPEGFSQAAGFSVSASSNGQVALAVNGSGPATKNVYLLTDFDGDGLYTGEGETAVLGSNAYLSDSLYRPRAVEFYNDDLDFAMTRGTSRGDVMFGTRAEDVILGLRGNDVISGGAGSDELWGGLGRDLVDGGAGDDVIRGGSEDDALFGAAGNDFVKGGAGDDLLTGGAGKDRFVFSATDGADSRDVIVDFHDGRDLIVADGIEVESVARSWLGVVVTFDDGSSVLVAGVSSAKLTEDDFVFTGGATGDFFV
jgi:Ca2+-binding RTX toxin-like protein